MSRDTLSDVLRAVRLRGAIFYHIEGDSPWVAETPPAAEILPGIMPGVGHLFEFHGLVEGACWAGVAGDAPFRLGAGDVVLFPQGDAHVLSSAPGLRAPSVDRNIFFAPQRDLPFSLSLRGAEISPGRLGSPTGERATVVCGFLGLDARPFNPLLAALPRVLHLPARALGEQPWVATLLRAVVAESNERRPGSEAVLERMSEMLFVHALRLYADSLPPDQTGWLAALRDPIVGRALALLHERPAEAWTLERLGEEAGLSRSALHERFAHLVGQPPMQYLTGWRMQLAAGLLRETNAKVIDVALRSGYESEAAFSRAFKRVVGVAPGAWRRGMTDAASGTRGKPRKNRRRPRELGYNRRTLSE